MVSIRCQTKGLGIFRDENDRFIPKSEWLQVFIKWVCNIEDLIQRLEHYHIVEALREAQWRTMVGNKMPRGKDAEENYDIVLPCIRTFHRILF